ncbi:cytochrome P450 [Kibdelosporangium philippinense]|uniref:Cytochrome P450 n=1 Tax=Kibdelosporangium philippinense TaxID=211113 RepID=A0ABS8ZRR9_9PSEU|nr:cytochrome P450 [Kibdelosporangium philippinense]MCE7010426.1 cytochrome P450 [Kibdelosporangium philippinense]
MDFPMPRTCPFDPAPELMRRLAGEPVARVRLWDGSTPWMITRYEDVRAVLSDPRVSVDPHHPGFPHTNAISKARDTRMLTLMQLDAPEHIRQRRLLTADFTVKRIEAMRPRIQQIVDEHVSRILAGPQPFDLVASLALPVPSLVICELLGVPYHDRAYFQDVASKLVMNEPDPAAALAASEELNGYLAVLPHKTGVLGSLAATGMPSKKIATIGQLLLIAGHDTTACMISLGIAALLANPSQWRAARDHDVTEELLRYLSITHTEARRVARADIEVGGTLIRTGEGMVVVKATANRDPQAFQDPDTLDVRGAARHHVAFGYGAHQCLGQALARAELQVVFSTVSRRMLGLTLVEPPELTENAIFYGARRLLATSGRKIAGS